MYIDRHEWNDVVEYRELYLRILKVILFTQAPPSFCQDEQPVEEYFIEPQHKSATLLFHYESTYHSNEDQGWMRAEKGNQPIKLTRHNG